MYANKFNPQALLNTDYCIVKRRYLVGDLLAVFPECIDMLHHILDPGHISRHAEFHATPSHQSAKSSTSFNSVRAYMSANRFQIVLISGLCKIQTDPLSGLELEFESN